MLYRAHNPADVPSDNGIMTNPFLRVDRRPRHSHYHLHLIMGLWFDQKFGLNFRANTFFCTGNLEHAQEFGQYVIEIEPVGDYQICFSHDVKDLYFVMERHKRSILPYHSNLETVFEILEECDFRHIKNDGLEEAAASGCEVMLYAQQYKFRPI